MHGTLPATPQRRPASGSRLPLLLRLAFRELRGGLQGFGIFLACIALGVAAIASVSSLSRSLTEGITREGRRILGGDMAFSLLQREAAGPERAFLETKGRVNVVATMRAMAVAGEKGSGLVEMKAVDGGYPTVGALETDPQLAPADLFAERNGAFGAAVDPALLARLDLKVGDRVTVGAANVELRARLDLRARQDRRRHRLRAAASAVAGGAEGHRPRPAGQPRALDLPAHPAALALDRGGADPDRGGGEPPPARGRLERPHAAQCRSALCPQHRALHPVPDPRRPHRPARGRRRRRQCGARLRRPQARLHRHPEEPRRAGRAGGAALPHAGDADRRRRHRNRPRLRCRLALRDHGPLRPSPADPDPADAGLDRARDRAALRRAHGPGLRHRAFGPRP